MRQTTLAALAVFSVLGCDTADNTDSGLKDDVWPGETDADADADADTDTDADADTDSDTDTDTNAEGTVLIDFESTISTPNFGGASGAAVADPTDGSNMVGELIKTAKAEVWAGVTLAYCPEDGTAVLPFSSSNTVITARVWSPSAGVPMRLKVEDASDGNVSVETEAQTTASGAWETLTFDFSSEVSGTSALNTANTYNKLSVFPNFGSTGAKATYYIDDITFIGAVFSNTCPSIEGN